MLECPTTDIKANWYWRSNRTLPVNIKIPVFLKLLYRDCGVWPQVRCGQGLTNGAGALARVLLQEFHNVSLLGGWAAAAHHSRALAGQFYKFMLIVPQANLEHRPGHCPATAAHPSVQGLPTSRCVRSHRHRSELLQALPADKHIRQATTGLLNKSQRCAKAAWGTDLTLKALSPLAGNADTRDTDRWADRRPCAGLGTSLTSRESPDMTSAQSCFLRKAFSSKWASPRLATCRKGRGHPEYSCWNQRHQQSTYLRATVTLLDTWSRTQSASHIESCKEQLLHTSPAVLGTHTSLSHTDCLLTRGKVQKKHCSYKTQRTEEAGLSRNG